MADQYQEDIFNEGVQRELIDAYKRAMSSNFAAGAEVAEATISSVNEAEAAVLTAENMVAHAEAVMEDAS
jgi:hypothetical protein